MSTLVGGMLQNFDEPADGQMPEETKQAAQVELATTSVEQTGGALLFHTNHRADVPSDGAPHTIAIARDDLPCAFDYVTAPVIDPVAYLRATITNRTERVGRERDPPTEAVNRCSVRFARALRWPGRGHLRHACSPFQRVYATAPS